MNPHENKSHPTDRRRVGSTDATSERHGTKRKRGADPGNIEKTDTVGSNVIIQVRSDALGKILKRLEILEKGFNDYVGSHRQRLEARLDDNKSFTTSFEQEMKLIRQEIYDLAAQEEEYLEDEEELETEEPTE